MRHVPNPWGWLGDQVASLGTASGDAPWPVDAEDAAEICGLAGTVVATAQQFEASRCASAADCHQLTRDVRDTVQLMVTTLRNPGLLDTDWVSPWMTPAS